MGQIEFLACNLHNSPVPFTLSHAAAALPFRRSRLVLSALVIGCFAPDFEYFLGHHGAFGHTFPGIFALDLPLGFVVLWLFHHYAKEPLVACLPKGARLRLDLGPQSLSINSIPRFALIACSILIGIATHIAWDSLTHPGFWPYQHWSFLRETVDLPLFGPRPWYGIFQYLSSLLGLVIVLIWCIHWYRSALPVHPDHFDRRAILTSRIVLICAFGVAILAGFLRAAASGIPTGITGSQKFATRAATTVIPVFWIGIVIYGVIRNLTNARAQDSVKQSR